MAVVAEGPTSCMAWEGSFQLLPAFNPPAMLTALHPAGRKRPGPGSPHIPAAPGFAACPASAVLLLHGGCGHGEHHQAQRSPVPPIIRGHISLGSSSKLAKTGRTTGTSFLEKGWIPPRVPAGAAAVENRPSEAGKPGVFPATLLCMPDSKSCLACRLTAPPSSGGSAPSEEPEQRGA